MMWKKKGNRIRASDKSLVYHFCIGWLLLLFVAVFLLLNLRQLLVIDWKDLTCSMPELLGLPTTPLRF